MAFHNLKKKYVEHGYAYLDNKSIMPHLLEIRKIINHYYPENIEHYVEEDYKVYHKRNVKVLNNIYKKIDVKSFKAKAAKEIAKNIGIKNDFLTSSFISYLATRPSNKGGKIHADHEYVDFHRENFYTDQEYANQQINVWVPLFDINLRQNFKFVPNSHLIDDEKIITRREQNKFIKKHSDAHMCGLNYAPKRIVSGVNLNNARRFNVPKNKFLILNANLIHGGGKNLSNKIRFAISFSIIEKKYFQNIKIPINFRSKKPHFVSL